MKAILPLLLLMFISLMSQGQDFENYTPLMSSGKIPRDFTIPSSKKYEADLKKISEAAKRRDKKRQKQFYLESNFHIDDMLQSGRVLFNDPVSNYITKVAHEVLKDEPRLKDKLRFYTLRSSAVNAFATDQGIIFVTMGLIAQLENEAQLAFVLSHEIAHIKEKHSLELYEEVDRLEKKNESPKRVLERTGFADAILAKSHYSKEKEMEADEHGLERFLKTDYDQNAVLSFFDVLRYSYLPFDEVKFEKSFFESKGFVFPDSYQRKEIKIIEGIDESEDDSRSSHPNLGTRKSSLSSKLNIQEVNQGKEFIVSKDDFMNVRDIARFELPLYQLQLEEFFNAIYSAYILLHKYPDNFYLKKCILQGLYSFLKHRNNKRTFSPKVEEVEGEIQGLYHFFSKISKEDLNILTVQYAWQLYLDNPDNLEVYQMAHDALIELVHHHNKGSEHFSKVYDSSNPKASDLVDSKKKLSKYDKIKLQREDNESWKHKAFVELFKEKHFEEAFEKALEVSEERKKEKEYYYTYDGAKQHIKEQDEIKNRHFHEVSKVLVLNPFYLGLDDRKKENKVLFVKSEEKQSNFRELIKENAELVGMKTKILDISEIRSSNIEEFNDIILLKEWVSEQIDFEDLSTTPGYRQSQIREIAEKYGTKYLILPGVISVHEKGNHAANLLVGVLAYPLLPIFIYDAIKPDYSSLLYMLVYDLETGRLEKVKFQFMKAKETNSILNLHLYDGFLQMHSKKKN